MKVINNIHTYESGTITHEQLYDNYILKNIPCVIKNFYPKNHKITQHYMDIRNDKPNGSIAYFEVGYKPVTVVSIPLPS